MQRLVTQMYFKGDPLIAMYPIFGTIPMDCRAYRFDIVLQGPKETVFLDI